MSLSRSFRSSTVLTLTLMAIGLQALSQGVPTQSSQSTQSAGMHDRIAARIDESEVVTLMGNTHPMARAEFDRGSIAAETELKRMVMLLNPDLSQQKDLDALSEAQQEPGSAHFHKWLSPAEYGSRFGVSSSDLKKLTNWLSSHGFTIEEIPAGRRLILFSGTAAQVADTFHTELHQYEVNGESHIANAQDPQIPQALAPVVAGIVSLHDFRRVSSTKTMRAVSDPSGTGPLNSQGSTHYIFPADFATIYDLNPLYSAGKSGAGVSIAIVGRSNINLNDVSSFRSYAGLPAKQPTVIVVGKNPGLVAGDQDEATLDVEWSGAVAPAAQVKLFAAASTATSDGVDLAAQYIVNNKVSPVMSTSFGNCEANMGSAELAFYNSLWQQASIEGISAFVSAGDSGASGCDSGSAAKGSGLAVNGMCSSPYSTCVGGTEFNEGANSAKYWSSMNGAGGASALTYIPETVWNESASNGGQDLWATGGGMSGVYVQPIWQRGVSGANSNGMRAVPDVSLTAAVHDGYLVCENGSWYVFGGTSASSPSFAGIAAIAVQSLGSTSGLGSVNPTLYGMLSASANPFHATPSGNNTVPGVTGYTASGANYNLATGLGSVDAKVLVNEWPTQSSNGGTQPGFVLKLSTAGVAVMAGKTTSFSVTVGAIGTFSGNVNLTAIAPKGVSLAFTPATVQAGSSTAVAVQVTTAANAGTNSIMLTGTGAGVSETASLPLTVIAPPTLAATTAVSKLSVIQGKTSTLAVAVSTGGTYSGAVTMAVSGLPAGVTASWSPATLSMTGAAVMVSTLTLTAATSAGLNSASLKITASGDGLQAQISCALQVMQPPSILLSLPSSQISMQATATQTMTVNITPQGGVAPEINLYGVSFKVAGLPTGVSAVWTAPSLTAAGIVQNKVNLVGSAAAGTTSGSITITSSVTDATTGIVYSASQQATLAVSAAHSLTMTPASASITVVKGNSATNVISIGTANTFNSQVVMAVSSLPAGVTASWSQNPLMPAAGSGNASSTLTLTAASSTATTSGSVIITATGGGVTTSKTISITIASSAVVGKK